MIDTWFIQLDDKTLASPQVNYARLRSLIKQNIGIFATLLLVWELCVLNHNKVARNDRQRVHDLVENYVRFQTRDKYKYSCMDVYRQKENELFFVVVGSIEFAVLC